MFLANLVFCTTSYSRNRQNDQKVTKMYILIDQYKALNYLAQQIFQVKCLSYFEQ